MNALLSQANEKKLDDILLQLRHLQGHMGGGARALTLQPTRRRQEMVVKLLGATLDMALAFAERDRLNEVPSSVVPTLLERLSAYQPRLMAALEANTLENKTNASPDASKGEASQTDTTLGLAVDTLVLKVNQAQLGQPYDLVREHYLSHAEGRTAALRAADEHVLTIGQKNVFLPQAYGHTTLTIKVAKKGDAPAQSFELPVVVEASD